MGQHIQILLTTLFWKHLRPLIEKGMVYVVQPPLYRYTKGKDVKYYYSDKEIVGVATEGYEITRFKGLKKTGPYLLFL